MGQNNMMVWVVLWGALIAFMIWSGKKKKKKQIAEEEKRINALKEGAKVLIFNNIKGTIISIGGEFAEVKVDTGVKLTVKKAVLAVVDDTPAPTTTADKK